ncbi:hypothetical protein NGM37_57220, partial [Streptomyces sp. TRM76130]|nr:hypothetical protein [Streptomyces sp. TRM76130]
RNHLSLFWSTPASPESLPVSAPRDEVGHPVGLSESAYALVTRVRAVRACPQPMSTGIRGHGRVVGPATAGRRRRTAVR